MTLYALGDLTPTLPETRDCWVAPYANVIGRVTIMDSASSTRSVVTSRCNASSSSGRTARMARRTRRSSDVTMSGPTLLDHAAK